MIPNTEIRNMLGNVILKEERGVAGIRYKKYIDRILEYCEEFVKNTPRMPIDGFDYTIPIPDSYLFGFDFLENPKMTVYLKEYADGNLSSGGGTTNINQLDYLTDDKKLKDIIFNIYGFSYNGKVFERTITNSIYHEINHCYDWWSRKGKKSVLAVPKDTGKKISVIFDNTTFSSYQLVDKFFKDLFYRLFIPTERRALVSTVYADLKAMNSKRTNFYEDIRETQAGNLLYAFSENLDLNIERCSIESLQICCRALHIDKISYKNIHEFVSSFKKRVLEEIRKTWKDVGRAASLWYDEQEEFKLLREEYITIDGPWMNTEIKDLKNKT